MSLIDDDDGYFFSSIICLCGIGSVFGMIGENLSDSPT